MASWRGWHLQPGATKEGPKLSHSRQLGNAPHTHCSCMPYPATSISPACFFGYNYSEDELRVRTRNVGLVARITNDSDAIDDVQILCTS